MRKHMCVYSLKEGADKEAFWEYHTQIHGPHVMKAGGNLQKYVIGRVIRTFYGKKNFFGFVEQVFNNEEDAIQYSKGVQNVKLPNGVSITDDFDSKEDIIARFPYVADEYVVKDLGKNLFAIAESEVVKRVYVTSPKPGIDEGDFWKHWTEEHAQDVVKISSPGLIKYVLSRVAEVRPTCERLAWKKKPFFALMEMWFENKQAMNKEAEAWKSVKLPNGRSIFDDFEDKVIHSWAAEVQEYVLKG